MAVQVFSLLLGEELISEALVEKIAGWRHSGFSVHSKVKASTKEEAERVGKYMIRPLLSLERISFSEKEGKVCYRYGKEAEELERMDYLEFIARTTSHIPDKGQVMIRYSGLYANPNFHQPPQADLCRSEASAASYRLSGTSDGRRGFGRIFFIIFSLPGRRGPANFRRFWRLGWLFGYTLRP